STSGSKSKEAVMRGRIPGSLMDWCRGHSCRWQDILFGLAAGTELPPDVARQQVDREQVIHVDQTAVAIKICQVGVGHLGSQRGHAFVGQVAILHETCVTQQRRLSRQLASRDLYPELPLPRRNGPGGESAVQCSLVGLAFCSCIVLPIGPASPSLDGCFLVRFGPLGLMKTY